MQDSTHTNTTHITNSINLEINGVLDVTRGVCRCSQHFSSVITLLLKGFPNYLCMEFHMSYNKSQVLDWLHLLKLQYCSSERRTIMHGNFLQIICNCCSHIKLQWLINKGSFKATLHILNHLENECNFHVQLKI